MQSIRGRIILLFVTCFIFGGVLTALHYANMRSLKRKMIMMENFDGLLDNILELRRFEKNFTYYRDAASIKNWETYMLDVENSFTLMRSDITEAIGSRKFQDFQDELTAYKTIMKKDMTQGENDQSAPTVRQIRDKGKGLVDYAQDMIRIKREHIDMTLNRSVMLPVTYFFIFILLTIIVFQLVDSSILKPLSLIKDALNHVALESFKPIAYHSSSENEITKLIDIFNKVALELETRQEQLVQSKKMASIGTFTSGIAHELNNPLNNISLTTETLQYSFDSIDAQERKTLLEDILTQADRASQVVKNLLEFSRMDKPAMIRLNIQHVLDRTIKLVKNQLMIKNIRLKKKFSDQLPQIYGKQQQLENAFVNIIINAIQAMPGGGTLSICAELGDDHTIRIDISDTGSGISEKQLGYIFDPFFTTKEVGKGTGLGLSLVYGIIRAHGGTIEVASKVDQGTCFTILLPTNTQKEDLS